MKRLRFSLILATISFLWVAESQTMLIPQPIYSDPLIWKLTRSVANQYLGVNFFFLPYASAYAFKSKPGGGCWYIGFFTDAVWNRIVYGDYYGNWIKAYGTLGAGSGEFDSPRGIAVDSFGNIYVADFNNGRIVKLSYNFEAETLSHVQGFYAGTFMAPPQQTIDF
jgi:hypothetical protein